MQSIFALKEGPRLKPDLLEIDITITLKNELADKIVREAAKRGRTPVDIMADVVEAVVNDDLWAAVLDN